MTQVLPRKMVLVPRLMLNLLQPGKAVTRKNHRTLNTEAACSTAQRKGWRGRSVTLDVKSWLFTDWIFNLIVCYENRTLHFSVGLRHTIGSYVYRLGSVLLSEEECDFYFSTAWTPPSLPLLPMGPSLWVSALSGAWGMADCSRWKLCITFLVSPGLLQKVKSLGEGNGQNTMSPELLGKYLSWDHPERITLNCNCVWSFFLWGFWDSQCQRGHISNEACIQIFGESLHKTTPLCGLFPSVLASLTLWFWTLWAVLWALGKRLLNTIFQNVCAISNMMFTTTCEVVILSPDEDLGKQRLCVHLLL